MDHRLLRLIIAAAFAVLANVFFFQPVGTGMISLTAIALWGLLTLIFITNRNTTHNTATILGYGVSVVTLATLAGWRGSPVAQSIVLGGAFGSVMLYAYALASGVPAVRSFMELLLVPFSFIGSYLSAWLEGITHASDTPKLFGITKAVSLRLLTTIIGIIVGLPIAGILLLLFVKADPIFAKVVTDTFQTFKFGDITNRLILTLGLFILLSPLGFLKINQEFTSPSQLFTKTHFSQIMTIVLAMVSGVLGLFLIVQWPYIFVRVAGETDLSTFGIATYSEYVKRGFSELLLISSMVYALLWTGLLALRGKRISEGKILTVMQLFLLSEFAIFILSVARRIKLYWDFHGLTLVRVYGGIFLAWITIFTVTLCLRLWFKQRIVRLELLLLALLLLGVGAWNAEQYIIYHHPPTVNGQVDYVYLARLSADGYDGWRQAYTHADAVLNNPELTTSAVIGKEQRRDIAYAGMVVGILSQKYDDLIQRYGSADEQKEYLKIVLMQEKQRIDTFIPQIQSDLTLIQQKGNNVNARWDGLFIPAFTRDGRSSELGATRDTLRESSKRISETLQTLADSSQSGTQRLAIVKPQVPGRLANFVHGSCGLVFSSETMATQWCMPSFYVVFPQGQEEFVQPTVWSRLASWNGIEEHVYRQFRMDIPYGDLQQLQERYLTLYERILAQNDSEKEYAQDISFDAPFLAPIN